MLTNGTNIINLPKAYAKQAKRNKSFVRLLAFAVLIKFCFGDSAFHPTVYNVKKLFHCSSKSAKKLIEDAINNKQLFYYCKKSNLLVARSFRRGAVVSSSPIDRSKKSYSNYCIKLQRPDEMSVAKMSIHIREQLALCAVCAKQRENTFIRSTKNFMCSDRSKALSLKKLSKIMGYKSCSTVKRHMDKLEEQNYISINRAPLVRLQPDEIREGRKYIVHNGFLYTREANEYTVNSNETMKRFCHIIYNHAERIGSARSNSRAHIVVEGDNNSFFSNAKNAMYN